MVKQVKPKDPGGSGGFSGVTEGVKKNKYPIMIFIVAVFLFVIFSG